MVRVEARNAKVVACVADRLGLLTGPLPAGDELLVHLVGNSLFEGLIFLCFLFAARFYFDLKLFAKNL